MVTKPLTFETSHQRGAIRIGVSGWRYEPWRGHFYPEGLRQADELSYAAGQLPTIELNGSFYSLQTPESYRAWYAATPPGFVFSVKAPRYLTHILKLREADKALANFFASGVFELKEKFGPLLWQLPPWFKFDEGVIEAFLDALPRDTAEALSIARKRDGRMTGRARLAIDAIRPLRHALEVRNASFVTPRFIELLRLYEVALVVADTGGRWPELQDVTADFVYLRLHGATELYKSRYSAPALRRWAARLDAWARGDEPRDGTRVLGDAPVRGQRDVYCYFDNTDKLHAPDNARQLLGRLGVRWPAQEPTAQPITPAPSPARPATAAGAAPSSRPRRRVAA